MSLADNVKAQIESQIISSTTGLGSTLTITPITQTKNAYGAYDDTEGTPVTVDAVPSRNFKYKLLSNQFKEVNDGDLSLVVSSDTSFNIEDRFTWQSKNYRIMSRQEVPLQNVILVSLLTLKDEF